MCGDVLHGEMSKEEPRDAHAENDAGLPQSENTRGVAHSGRKTHEMDALIDTAGDALMEVSTGALRTSLHTMWIDTLALTRVMWPSFPVFLMLRFLCGSKRSMDQRP